MTIVQSPLSFSLLIVDDDKAARDIMARMVPKKFPNCTVYSADNGIEGMELFKNCNPDIVVTDVNMPIMDGVEMIREINLTKRNTAFIVLTAYSDPRTFERFKDLACSCLLKPLDFNELFVALEKCLARIEPQEP